MLQAIWRRACRAAALLLSCLGEFAVPFVVDGLLTAGELVGGRDIAQGTVQPRVVEMLDEVRHDAASLVQSQRRFLADAIVLDSAVIAFQFAVGLRVVRAGADMRHATQPDELFEVAGDELRAVIADDAWPRVGELFASPLQEGLDILLGHGLANLPMHDEEAVAIQHDAEVIERVGDVEVRDVEPKRRLEIAKLFF